MPIDSLLDINRNMDQMTGREKIFYEDQQSSRECHLSEEVYEEFEKENQAQFEEEMEIEKQCVLEITFINEEETEQVTPRSQNSSFLTSRINRSGLSQGTRQLSVKETQIKFMF